MIKDLLDGAKRLEMEKERLDSKLGKLEKNDLCSNEFGYPAVLCSDEMIRKITGAVSDGKGLDTRWGYVVLQRIETLNDITPVELAINNSRAEFSATLEEWNGIIEGGSVVAFSETDLSPLVSNLDGYDEHPAILENRRANYEKFRQAASRQDGGSL